MDGPGSDDIGAIPPNLYAGNGRLARGRVAVEVDMGAAHARKRTRVFVRGFGRLPGPNHRQGVPVKVERPDNVLRVHAFPGVYVKDPTAGAAKVYADIGARGCVPRVEDGALI